MAGEKKSKYNLYSDIESDLFSIINTILNLNKKYQSGNLKQNFFQKLIKNSLNELLKINFLLNENEISLSNLLENMNFTDRYYEAIDIINNISGLNFHENYFRESSESIPSQGKSLRSSILEVPGITAQITSSFITLIDALKLDALNNKNILIKLFEDIKENLNKFPGLELIQVKFEKLYKYTLDNYPKFTKNKNFRDSIEDDLYKLYQQFQDKLNLNG